MPKTDAIQPLRIAHRPIVGTPGTQPNRETPLSGIVLMLLGALLVLTGAGCSRFGTVYNRLDLLAGFQLRSFVSLSDSQRRHFRSAFEQTWNWHRSTQLPRYATQLRTLSQKVDAPLDARELLALETQARSDGRRLGSQLVQAAAPIVASFSDKQVRTTLAEIDERVDKARRENTERSDRVWIEWRYEKALDRLEEWAGPATKLQKARLHAWAESMLPLRPPYPDPRYRAWRAELEALLRQRQSADFAARLQALVLTEPGENARIAAERETNRALMLALSRDATPEQRAHLRRKLEELAQELDSLAQARPA